MPHYSPTRPPGDVESPARGKVGRPGGVLCYRAPGFVFPKPGTQLPVPGQSGNPFVFGSHYKSRWWGYNLSANFLKPVANFWKPVAQLPSGGAPLLTSPKTGSPKIHFGIFPGGLVGLWWGKVGYQPATLDFGTNFFCRALSEFRSGPQVGQTHSKAPHF